MLAKIKEKLIATRLRGAGYSIGEIQRCLGVSKSSISVWTSLVRINKKMQKDRLRKIVEGSRRGVSSKKLRAINLTCAYLENSIREIRRVVLDKRLSRIICGLLLWCEGSKDIYKGVRFTNSDPGLVKTFLYFFRKGYNITESRLRVCMHLHSYHDRQKQTKFWAEITRIPADQFTKPYIKPNSGNRKKLDYPGCVSIRYQDNNLARNLLSIAEAFRVLMGVSSNGRTADSKPANSRSSRGAPAK